MKLGKIFFYLFLISIPFGTRILLYQFTPGFNEYNSVFLYASDIFLILFLATPHPYRLQFIRMKLVVLWPLLAVLFLAAVSVFFALSPGLAIYNLARLFSLALAAITAAVIIREGIVKLDSIFAILAGSAAFQSILGFLQFIKQSSLGLSGLGEPLLGPQVAGAAKIIVEGDKILRAYGTFPHPNVLAAFLLLGLFGLYYLWMKSDAHPFRIFSIGSGIFIVFTGLLLTFSRTAWVIAILLTLLASGYTLVAKQYRERTLFLLLALLVSGYTLVAIFSSYIFPRAQISEAEPAVTYRLAYNKMAVDIIKENPLGVGIGNQVLHSAQNGIYQKFGMDQAWQWQPIHNIYLLAGSEVGILGAVAFIIFLLCLLIPNSKFLISNEIPITNDQLEIRNSSLVIGAIMLGLLLFGAVDHFLWTLQPGRLMLWLAIGLLISLFSKP